MSSSPTTAVLPGGPFADDTLLPGPTALLGRLAGRLADRAGSPATLAVVGLLRRDDGWPTAPATMRAVTALLASGVRGEDWLAREGAAKFAVLVAGGPDGAEVAVRRLVGAVGGVVTGVAACAGLAALEPGLTAEEVRRGALLSLAAARTRGAGALVRYRGGR
ncbi:hypothetical protein [Geodermatophilus sp. SYSU D00815]